MNLWEAIKTKQIANRPLREQQLHVMCDGRPGVVESIRYEEVRGYFMVTLRHFNGEPFPHEYAAGACELLERR